MKTLLYFASDITNSGGVSRVLSLKLNYLADVLGYQIHIVSTNNTFRQPFYFFSSKITFHFIDVKMNTPFHLIAFKKQSQQIIKKVLPHVVLVTDNGIKGLFIKQWVPKGIFCIYELHMGKSHFLNSGYSGIKRKINKYLLKRNIPKFDKIVVLQPFFLFDFIPESKQVVIANPLSFETKEINVLNHKKVIAVGRLIALKGYERMLKAWQKVVQKYPDYVLEIYGAASSGYEIEKIINDLHLKKNVSVFQPTSQIKEKYLGADFLIHASFYESFGMVFLEAMQCGLPVICFDIGVNDFLKEDNSFTVTNETDFVSAVTRLIENPVLRQQMGENGKIQSDKYKISKIMRQWDNLFKQI